MDHKIQIYGCCVFTALWRTRVDGTTTDACDPVEYESGSFQRPTVCPYTPFSINIIWHHSSSSLTRQNVSTSQSTASGTDMSRRSFLATPCFLHSRLSITSILINMDADCSSSVPGISVTSVFPAFKHNDRRCAKERIRDSQLTKRQCSAYL